MKNEKNAIILAAGLGLRTIPINLERPKALLEVHGEVLIERLISQLQEAGIRQITVVVGYLKEQLTYLGEKYGVNLVENLSFSTTNSFSSLNLVKDNICNSYILPSDIWLQENFFSNSEDSSWYLLSSMNILELSNSLEYWDQMLGIAYISEKDSLWFQECLTSFSLRADDQSFWEEAFYIEKKFTLPVRSDNKVVYEINTFEDLKQLDKTSEHLKSEVLDIISEILQVSSLEIEDIQPLKKGMTNRSFLFTCQNQQYIMRIPGEGTDQLINRKQEATVYEKIRDIGLCDPLIYINPRNGFKITQFLDNTRVCNPNNWSDISKCMLMLREFHNLELNVEHEFDLFGQIEFYESLKGNNTVSCFEDYLETKTLVYSLRDFVENNIERKVLTHIDAIPDNFLIDSRGEIRLIDWEYAGMQDPHVDIAMFAIYSQYDNTNLDRLIDSYFLEGCSKMCRLKIYSYVAICGLLWSNWCEYKHSLGIDFGDYAQSQYEYAKTYAAIVREKLGDLNE